MTPETWRRVKPILAEAIDAPPAERRALIVGRAAGDASLVRELESLLRGDSVVYEHDDAAPAGADDALASTRDEPTPPTIAGARDDAPRVWGDFLLLEELGRGGFGVVYRAWDPHLQRDVALKVINLRRLSSQRREMLLHEGQMLARLHHPNVVTVHAVQRRGADVGLVMEYIRGLTLADHVARTGPMKPEHVARIGVTLCQALTAVHRAGLVHRDVKAANVMHEHGGRIVLMDFGAGHAVVSDTVEASMVVGTPLYMSPEVLAGKVATPASDIYSLGVLLYYLLTSTYPPREGAGNRDPTSEDIVRSLCTIRPGLSQALVEAVSTSLSPDRSARPQVPLLSRLLESAATGARKRRSTRASEFPRRPADRRPRAAMRRTLVGTVLGVAATGILLTTLVGFVTTLEFNAVLGRSGEFASESGVTYLSKGAQALLAPVVHLAIAGLLASVAPLAVRLLAQILPTAATGPMASGAHRLGRRLDAAGLTEPAAVCQLSCLFGLLGLGLVVVVFSPLFGAYMTRADVGAGAVLAVLSPVHSEAHSSMRLSLSAVQLVLVAGLLHVRGFWSDSRLDAVPAGLAEWKSTAGLVTCMLIVLMVQTAPWRLIWDSKFHEATFEGRLCFVVSESRSRRLLHCPGASPPRNRVVRDTDARLADTATVRPLFCAYVEGPCPSAGAR